MPKITLEELHKRLHPPQKGGFNTTFLGRFKSGVHAIYGVKENRKAIRAGYLPEQELGFVLTSLTQATVKLNKYIHPLTGEHLLTISTDSDSHKGFELDDTVTAEGACANPLYVFNKQTVAGIENSSWVPVYCYSFNTRTEGRSPHKLGIRSNIYSTLHRDKIEEQIKTLPFVRSKVVGFHIVESSFGVKLHAAQGMVPLYVASNKDRHLTMQADKSADNQIVGYVYQEFHENTLALYEWRNPSTQKTIYTTKDDATSIEAYKEQGFSEKRLICYVFPANKIPLRPVFRWHMPVRGNYYTSHPQDEPKHFSYQGVAFYTLAKEEPGLNTTELLIYKGPFDYPLHHAAAMNLVPETQYLLEHSPQAKDQKDEKKRTPIDVAFEFGSLGAMQVLSAKGCEITNINFPFSTEGTIHCSTERIKIAEGIFITKGASDNNFSYTAVLDVRDKKQIRITHVGVHDGQAQSSFNDLMAFLAGRNTHGLSNISNFVYTKEKAQTFLASKENPAAVQPTLARKLVDHGINLLSGVQDKIENTLFKMCGHEIPTVFKLHQFARGAVMTVATTSKDDTPIGVVFDGVNYAIAGAALRSVYTAPIFTVGYVQYANPELHQKINQVLEAHLTSVSSLVSALPSFGLATINAFATRYANIALVQLFHYVNLLEQNAANNLKEKESLLATPFGKIFEAFSGALPAPTPAPNPNPNPNPTALKPPVIDVPIGVPVFGINRPGELLNQDFLRGLVKKEMQQIFSNDSFNPYFSRGSHSFDGKSMVVKERLSDVAARVIMRNACEHSGIQCFFGPDHVESQSEFHGLFNQSPAQRLLFFSNRTSGASVSSSSSASGNVVRTSGGSTVQTSSGTSVSTRSSATTSSKTDHFGARTSRNDRW